MCPSNAIHVIAAYVVGEAGEAIFWGEITNAANEQLGFRHPVNPHWKHIWVCAFCGPLG